MFVLLNVFLVFWIRWKKNLINLYGKTYYKKNNSYLKEYNEDLLNYILV